MAAWPAGESFRSARVPRWLALAVAFVFVFVAGLCIPYSRAERLEARLTTTTRALTLARLESTLSTAALEARRGRYESARQLSSDFFTRLQQATGGMPADARDEAQSVLARRDTTITLLSRSAATSPDLLDQLLAQYEGVLRATGAAAGNARATR